MRLPRAALAVVAVAIALLPVLNGSPAIAAPTVVNGDMEAAGTGWCTASGSSPEQHKTYVADGGTQVLDSYATTAGQDSFSHGCADITLTAGQTVTGWWKANAGGTGEATSSRSLVIAGAGWSDDTGGLAGTTWRRISVTVGTSGAYRIRLYTLAGTGGRWDNIRVWDAAAGTEDPPGTTTTTTTVAPTTTTTVPPTTTTTVPPTTTTTSNVCAWERGGVVEAAPAVCPDVADVTLPAWSLLAAALAVFAAFAHLVGSWRQ